MTHGEYAEKLFRDGYNCSQAVLLAFSDVTGLDDETAAKLALSFGGGFGRMREICGAVSGAGMVGSENGLTPEKRTESYYKKRPCPEIVRTSAEILEKMLADIHKI